VAVNAYGDSYRLRDIDGRPAMTLPREQGDPTVNWQEFSLCFDCHNRNELLVQIPDDLTEPHTNFWDVGSGVGNAHTKHLNFGVGSDSDWDLTNDSSPSCIHCHNVHGSPTGVMIRYGQLISTPGTSNKVPALDFTYLVGGVYEATATWSAPVGTYKVYARWSAGPKRATNAKYTVNHSSGSVFFTKNQQVDGGSWNLLGGPYTFGSGDSVVLSIEGADGVVCADAIGWDSDGSFYPDPEHVVDDGDASYTSQYWTFGSGQPGYYGTGYHYHYKPGGTPIPDPGASLEDSMGGQMRHRGLTVAQTFVCNTCHWPAQAAYTRDPYLGPKVLSSPGADPVNIAVQEATLVTFRATVRDPDNSVDTVTINLSAIGGGVEAMSPVDTDSDGNGIYSYQTTVPASDSGYLSFLVTATDTEAFIGEGTITLKVGTFVIVDNPYGTFTGSWPIGTGNPGYYGANYQYHLVGAGSDYFRWTPTITTPGTYEVFARWTSGASRAPDATYTINYDGGSADVPKDQTTQGGDWVSLGASYSFDGVDDYVELTQNPNGSVCADAIKWELQP
jgi:hypothetical protein